MTDSKVPKNKCIFLFPRGVMNRDIDYRHRECTSLLGETNDVMKFLVL